MSSIALLLTWKACPDCLMRGESSVAELCRKEGIKQNLYYR